LTDYVVTSPKDASYNCIAFAAGDTARKWDPGRLPEPGYYWPADATRDDNDSIDALKLAFRSIGFDECPDGGLEEGYRKVALYAIHHDDWLHVAIQEASGDWSSKLGSSYDIRHKTPQCVEGATYGKVVCFMKKSVTAA
jgi:hypothetical protein